MRITNLTTAVLEANFDWTIVKLETDAGVTGYGEAFCGPGVTAIIREFREVLIGEDITSIDRFLRKMKARVAYCSPGLVLHAVYGIEAAALDAIGKRHKMPVWQILGGKYRDEVQIYADCHGGDALESITPLLQPRTPQWMGGAAGAARKSEISVKHHGWDATQKEELTPHAYGARAAQMVSRGFTMLKFDLDVPTPYETDEYNRDLSRAEIEFAATLVEAVRHAVGRHTGIAFDCHWNYGVQAAVEMARAIEEYHLLWLEDPLPPENIRAFHTVQSATRTPIATGENHFTRTDMQRLITEGGLRVLAPDVQKIGLWDGRKIGEIADMHYVNLTLHNISGPLGTIAGVHLAAAIPNILALEWHAASVPFFDELVKGAAGPMIHRGKIRVPEAPGLGIEIDEDVAHKYRKPGERFFE
ncbi:MAG: mandelate racemase/muconate lactonizing enzyme family protein [Bryobacteraceae bacterium]|nr:mandelate racemase/muconate lactonizing enzyme family protein [Bryobacteraceae bacterium]